MWQGWMKCSPTPPPALPAYPAGGDLSPQRTRNDCTSQAAAQAVPEPGRGKYQGRPCKARHTPRRWTRCTGLHSIPDRPRLDDRTGCGVLDCLCNVSETEQIRTLERHTKTGLKIITFSCMFVACATLQIHQKVLL